MLTILSGLVSPWPWTNSALTENLSLGRQNETHCLPPHNLRVGTVQQNFFFFFSKFFQNFLLNCTSPQVMKSNAAIVNINYSTSLNTITYIFFLVGSFILLPLIIVLSLLKISTCMCVSWQRVSGPRLLILTSLLYEQWVTALQISSHQYTLLIG